MAALIDRQPRGQPKHHERRQPERCMGHDKQEQQPYFGPGEQGKPHPIVTANECCGGASPLVYNPEQHQGQIELPVRCGVRFAKQIERQRPG